MVSDFDKKGNKKFFNDKLLFKAVGVALLFIIGLLFFEDFEIYQKKKELSAEISSYKKQIEEIEKSNQNLKEEIANADNPDYLEKIAYEQLDQQKPGEKEIIFIALPEKQEQASVQKSFWDNFSGWFLAAFNWIKNKF